MSFSKYFKYILNKNGFTEIEEEVLVVRNLISDLKATLGGIDYYFEFKISKRKRFDLELIDRLINAQRSSYKIVLVTNVRVDLSRLNLENLIVIDSDKLSLIAKDSRLLVQMLYPPIGLRG